MGQSESKQKPKYYLSFDEKSQQQIKQHFDKFMNPSSDCMEDEGFIKIFKANQQLGTCLLIFLQKQLDLRNDQLTFNDYLILIEIILSSSVSNNDQYIDNQKYQKVREWVEKDILELLIMIFSGVYDSNKPMVKEDVENAVIQLVNVCLQSEDDFSELMVNQENKSESRVLNGIMNSVYLDSDETDIYRLCRKISQNMIYIQKRLQNNLMFIMTGNCRYQQQMKPRDKQSNILNKQDFLLLELQNNSLNMNRNVQLDRIYCSQTDGTSLNKIIYALVGYGGPTLMIIKHYQTEEKKEYIFGGYNQVEWEDSLKYQGDFQNYLFSMYPRINLYQSGDGKGLQNYCYLNSRNINKSQYKQGIGFGGQHYQDYRIWIDNDVEDKCTVSSENGTYKFGCMADYHIERLNVVAIEVWGLGGQQAKDQQTIYRENEKEQLTKMRKVDKKQFLNKMDMGLIMGETFKHQQQARVDIDQEREEQQS